MQMTTSGTRAFQPATDPAQLVVGEKAGIGVSKRDVMGIIHQTIITFKDLVITMTDAGAAGNQGSQKIYDFPAGVIQIMGALMNLTTRAGTGGIADNAALVGSVGSAAAGVGDATLTGTEADIVASFAGTLVGGVGILQKFGSLVAAAFDGHTTPLDAFLNIAVPDAASTGNDTIIINGTVTIFWYQIGDF